MKQLNLTNSAHVALVDDEDYERLLSYRWYNNGTSIKRSEWAKPSPFSVRKKTIDTPLANEVMQKFGVIFDHKDRDRFNNQKQNLREVTFSENNQNRTKSIGFSSIYKGVYKDKTTRKWAAQIRANGKKTFLGLYKTQEEAALAYNVAAKEKFGEFACLNTICS